MTWAQAFAEAVNTLAGTLVAVVIIISFTDSWDTVGAVFRRRKKEDE